MRGQAAHPDTEVLAEFRAGLISGMRGRRLAAHLAGCSQCAATAAALASVSAALAAVPVPSLPDPVAARISMALAAEASARATRTSANGEAAAASTGNGHRPRAPLGRRRNHAGGRWLRPVRPAILAPAAAVCLLLAGGGYLLSQLGSTSGPSNMSPHVAAPAIASHSDRAAHSRPLEISPSTPVGGTVAAGSAGTRIIVVESGADYQHATLRPDVEAQLKKPPTVGTAATATLSGCALKLAGDARPVFVDKARYQTKPAYVIVTDREAWVVSTNCTAARPDVITSVPLSLSSP